MQNVIFDTNVLVAALLSGAGANREALHRAIALPEEVTICFSSPMMEEYEDVLARPLMRARGLIEPARELLELIRDIGQPVLYRPLGHLVYPDPSDRYFLETAVYVGGILVTNNVRDYPFAGVCILKPGQFLASFPTHPSQS